MNARPHGTFLFVFLLLASALEARAQTDPRAAREAWLNRGGPRPVPSQVLIPSPQPPTGTASDWQALGGGLSGYGEALALSDTTLWVGGIFLQAGSQLSQGIARWDGSWSGAGGGTNGFVFAVAVRGSDVYVAGQFTMVGVSVNANNIARWDGSSWHALGSGLTSSGSSAYVLSLTFRDSILYAGGSFTTAGGFAASNLARWDGGSWAAVNPGPLGTVSALAVRSDDLYVGGAFTNVGGVPKTRCIARWNGSQWFEVGGGTDNTVTAIAFQGSSVLVGGFFDSVGTVRAPRIGRWTGSAWQPLGYGLTNVVNAIVPLNDGSVFAGGNFDYKYTATDSVPASYVARWRNGDWQSLESGLNGPANALAYRDGDLYVTGYFSTAAGQTVNGVALWREKTTTAYRQGWNIISMPRLASSIIPDSVFPGSFGIYRFSAGSYSRPSAIEFGRGYWAYYPVQTTNSVVGVSSDSVSLTIAAGNTWVLIGSATHPAPLSAITSTPAGAFIPETVFDYTGAGYSVPAILEPGRGYWLYVLQPCTIHIVVP